MQFYLSDQHARLATPIVSNIKDIEHYRSTADYMAIKHSRTYYHWNRPQHTAVVVLKDGSCYVGVAVCSEKDNYNRKIGYTISVGRALKAIRSGEKPDFTVDPNLEGLALRDRCRYILTGDEVIYNG